MNLCISTRSQAGFYNYNVLIHDLMFQASITRTYEGKWSMSVEDSRGREQFYWVFDTKSAAYNYLKKDLAF